MPSNTSHKSSIVSKLLRKPQVFLLVGILLFLLSLLFNSEYSQRSAVSRERKKLENYIHKEMRSFYKITADTQLIKDLASGAESLEDFRRVANRRSGIYLYKHRAFEERELIFWSDQKVLPGTEALLVPDGEYFGQYPNGYYVTLKHSLDSTTVDTLVAYCMIPVQYEYYVANDQFPVDFVHNKRAGNKIEITYDFTEFPVKTDKGDIIFYLKPKAFSPLSTSDQIAVWLRIVAFLLLLVFIHFVCDHISDRYGAWKGIGLLVVAIVTIRVLSYYIPFPINLRQFDLFDPAVYGSNSVQRSLGDLLINSILFCWIVLFIWVKQGRRSLGIFSHTAQKTLWMGVIAALLLVATTFTAAYIVRSLALDSNISFDVMNFFSLNRFSAFGFAILSIISIGYYYFTRLIIRFMETAFREQFVWAYVVIAVSGLAFLTFIFVSPHTRFFVFVLAWLLLYTFFMQQNRFVINRLRVNVASALFWMFVFSVSITIILFGTNRQKEWEIRKRLATKIHVENDPVNDRQLSISLAYLDDDFFQDNFNRFYNAVDGGNMRDSILRRSFLLNKYDSKLFVFDSAGRGIFNDEAESYSTLNTIFTEQAKPSSVAHLNYYETSFDRFTFIYKREIKDPAGRILGSVFVLANPKDYTTDALYVEIFRQQNANTAEESPLYSYAIYNNNKLISPVKYSFPTSLTKAQIPYDFEKRVNGQFDELWYKASAEKVIVIAKKRDTLIEAITLFSYIFCVFLLFVFLIGIVVLAIRVIQQRMRFAQAIQMNIRTQVHTTIIFISLLSFLVIGVATISFFISRYKRNNTDKLSRTMEVMVNEMQKRMEQLSVVDDVVTIHDTVSGNELNKLVNDVADVHGVDVNVYDTTGHLKVTSRPLIYREGYLSFKMHPEAFYYLNRLRRGQHTQQESLASLSYLSIYGPVRNAEGDVEAYLNIPYFLSQQELNQEISNFLVTIIILNAFIFLIAGVIALFITNRITRSFSVISEKMKEINVGRANEMIVWSRDDEIGELVKEYNKMVGKLGESADALARSEREGAWREMARQVAHEIKNPLTPMKLSIQHLQKSINNNSGNVKEMTGNVAKTLVEQIDHLAKIAADFSQFANIGNTNPEVFNLHDVILSLRDLYTSNHEVSIQMELVAGAAWVKTDRTQMNRLFTNLLQNAVEACSENDLCIITIKEERTNTHVRMSISDNGHGIPAEMHSKIFVPNFTTKSSGTGLGLAMVKSILEQAGGKIWFETSMERGTTFFVEIPLHLTVVESTQTRL